MKDVIYNWAFSVLCFEISNELNKEIKQGGEEVNFDILCGQDIVIKRFECRDKVLVLWYTLVHDISIRSRSRKDWSHTL